jgi:cytochrome P450
MPSAATDPSRGPAFEPSAAFAAQFGGNSMSTQVADTSLAARLKPPKRSALAHIPGDEGWPIVGQTFEMLADPKGHTERMAARYGPVFRCRNLGETNVTLLGPEANERVLLDKAKIFSSSQGWEPFLGRLFPRGLMLLDADEHRRYRRALSVAFKPAPMRSYLAALDREIAGAVARWRAGPGDILFYPAMKRLTLDLAATSFLGAEIGAEADEITRAFVDMVAATVAPIRTPWPGTAMARGVRGRARVVAYFSQQIPIRRATGGDDLFSQLCRATHEDGALLSVRDIVDHMSFFMMAAHDTLSSSLTALVSLLAADAEWQRRLRGEVAALGIGARDPLPFEKLDAMPLTEMAFKEALRLIPPLAWIVRRATRELTFDGFAIPPGTLVAVSPLYTHHMPQIWPEPDRFEPGRFDDAAQRERHRFAWVPFGGGVHMCLGLQFAAMQAKCFCRHFVQNFSVSLADGYAPEWQYWPIARPKDGLRATLTPLR